MNTSSSFIEEWIWLFWTLLGSDLLTYHLWPSMQKYILSTKAFSRGFEVTVKPLGNPLETLWNPLETLLKHFETLLKCFETLWKPFWNALKPFGNPFEMLWNSFEMLWNPLETLLKCFETLWNVEHIGNPLEMFRILFENLIWKCQGKKKILLVCVRWRNCTTALHVNFFCRNVILPYDSVLIYLRLWKDQKI